MQSEDAKGGGRVNFGTRMDGHQGGGKQGGSRDQYTDVGPGEPQVDGFLGKDREEIFLVPQGIENGLIATENGKQDSRGRVDTRWDCLSHAYHRRAAWHGHINSAHRRNHQLRVCTQPMLTQASSRV